MREFAKQIDVTNAEQILNYGSAAQKNVADFSDAALSKVRTKDMGEIGQELSDLVIELQGLDFEEAEEKKGFMGLFKKARQNIASLKAQYDKAEENVDKITAELEKHELTLMKDIAMMDKLYERNQQYYKELTMYIVAGKLRCSELREKDLPEAQLKAQQSGLPEDAQAANDLANMIGRFEKKLHDLELTRMISVQMAPQIRMIQSNDAVMSEKIRSSIVNTIPLWKSQMVLALTLHHSQQAMEAQREVNDVTNRLLRANAEKLHQGSVDIARRERTRHSGHRNAAKDQSGAHRHARGGSSDTGGRREKARGGGGRARPNRGRAQAEAPGAEGLIGWIFSNLRPARCCSPCSCCGLHAAEHPREAWLRCQRDRGQILHRH